MKLGQPRAVGGRVFAKARPDAIGVALPKGKKPAAFTPATVHERWSADAAGLRPAALAGGDNVITMFDLIGEDFWTGGGITAAKVAAQLRAIGDRPVEVQINSPGGDMFEGIAIYNVLREHPQEITVKVMGMAASAASIIAMAGDRIEIGAASFLMIHNCWVLAVGNRHDMTETAEWLAPFDAAMVAVYEARSGSSAADIAAWMDAETYMGGALAIERGFADALLPADQVREDATARASDRALNEVRAMELTLCASGMSRTQARERIAALRGTTPSSSGGTPGAAPITGTPGAADRNAGEAHLRDLLAALKGN